MLNGRRFHKMTSEVILITNLFTNVLIPTCLNNYKYFYKKNGSQFLLIISLLRLSVCVKVICVKTTVIKTNMWHLYNCHMLKYSWLRNNNTFTKKRSLQSKKIALVLLPVLFLWRQLWFHYWWYGKRLASPFLLSSHKMFHFIKNNLVLGFNVLNNHI